MSLRVWLPLNGNLNNQGLSNYNISMFRGTEIYNNNGKIGKCFHANGVNTIKILNMIPDVYNYAGYSLCAWFYIEGQNTSHSGSAIISAGNWNNQLLNLSVSDWSTDHYTRLRVSGTSWNYTYSYNFLKNIWYHVVVCSDGQKTYAYVNGILIGDSVVGFLPTSIEGNDICIGGATYYSGMQFFGRINDVRIYDHCLSKKEIEEISKGLVLHYKLNDAYNEESTFLTTGISSTAYNASLGKYGYNTDSNLGKINGFFQGRQCTKVYTLTAGQTAQPYVYFSNLFTSDGTNAPAYKALSFDYYTTVPTTTWLNIYKLGSGSGTVAWKVSNSNGIKTGTYTNSSNSILVIPNEWNHVEVILHGTTANNAEWGYCVNGPAHTSNENYYFLYANIQLEENDHSTGYNLNMHSNIIYDSSGYQNNGIIFNPLKIETDTLRYNVSTLFDGETSAIKVPYTDIASTDDIFTLNLWFKKDDLGSKNYETLFGGPSGFEMDTRAGAATTLTLYMASTRGSNFAQFNFGEWYMITMVNNGTSELYYVNAELKKTIDKKPMPAGNYYIGAWSTEIKQNYKGLISDFRIYKTALTAEQIKELYDTSATIDKDGNIYAREVIE